MTVAIVGFGVEGEASASYWHELGHNITVCDINPDIDVPNQYQSKLGDNYLTDLNSFDIVVRTAGMHPRTILEKNPGLESKITTSIQEFMRVCPTHNIIGVTGTKGKGTTSTLIAKMLEAAGKKVHIGGNIGTAALEMLSKIASDDYVVLELSSFQLEDFNGPSPHLAVCLMVTPEHLNWHANMDEYLAAKARLFQNQSENDTAIFYAHSENSKKIASASPGNKLPYYEKPGAFVNGEMVEIDSQAICQVNEIGLPGKHNWQNVCAAVTAVWQVSRDIQAIKQVLTSFKGLEHRIELVKELDGVKYYDDSFATTPETAIAAIQAFDEPKVLLLGGSDKGIPLDPIVDEVMKSDVRHVVTIGLMGKVIEKLLRDQGFSDISPGLSTMAEIVAAARSKAQAGDVILLSTGCASYDMFKDYKDRGDQFKQAVRALA